MPKENRPPTVTGRDAYIARLRSGETVQFRESGNSMTPRIKHRQLCTYAPVTGPEDVRVGDAVFCKVRGNYYTHLIKGIKGDAETGFQCLIGNNRGRLNGWTPLDSIYGKVVKVED